MKFPALKIAREGGKNVYSRLSDNKEDYCEDGSDVYFM